MPEKDVDRRDESYLLDEELELTRKLNEVRAARAGRTGPVRDAGLVIRNEEESREIQELVNSQLEQLRRESPAGALGDSRDLEGRPSYVLPPDESNLRPLLPATRAQAEAEQQQLAEARRAVAEAAPAPDARRAPDTSARGANKRADMGEQK